MKLTQVLEIANSPNEHSVETLESAHHKLARRSTKLEKIGREGYRRTADNLYNEIIWRYINNPYNR